MQSMVTNEAGPIEIDASLLGRLELSGFDVPYIDLEGWPSIHSRLVVNGTEYAFSGSFPVKGHSAVMPGAVAELQAQGKQILVVERDERYCVYVA